MKPLLIILTTIILTVSLYAGTVIENVRKVGNFNRIHLKTTGTLQIRQGDGDSLVVLADESLQKYLVSEVRDGELILTRKPGVTPFIPDNGVTWIVTVRELEQVKVSGSGRAEAEKIKGKDLRVIVSGSGKISFGALELEKLGVKISGSGFLEISSLKASDIGNDISGSGSIRFMAVEADEIESSMSGGGDIIMKGKASETSVEISGSAKYNALDLVSENVTVEISGSGKAAVNARAELRIKSTGSGSVFYRGRPRITQKISGSTEITQVD